MSTKTQRVPKPAVASSAAAKPKRKPMTLSSAQPNAGRIAFAELNFCIIDVENMQSLTNFYIRISCEGIVKNSPHCENVSSLVNFEASFASYTAHSWLAVSLWQKAKGFKFVTKGEYKCLGEAYVNVAQLNGSTRKDFWLSLGPDLKAGYRMKVVISLAGSDLAGPGGLYKRSGVSSGGSQSTTSSSLSGYGEGARKLEAGGGTAGGMVGKTLEETLNRKPRVGVPGGSATAVGAATAGGLVGPSGRRKGAASSKVSSEVQFDPFNAASSGGQSKVGGSRSRKAAVSAAVSKMKGLDMEDPFGTLEGGTSSSSVDVGGGGEGEAATAFAEGVVSGAEFFDFDKAQEEEQPVDVLDNSPETENVVESGSIDLFDEHDVDDVDDDVNAADNVAAAADVVDADVLEDYEIDDENPTYDVDADSLLDDDYIDKLDNPPALRDHNESYFDDDDTHDISDPSPLPVDSKNDNDNINNIDVHNNNIPVDDSNFFNDDISYDNNDDTNNNNDVNPTYYSSNNDDYKLDDTVESDPFDPIDEQQHINIDHRNDILLDDTADNNNNPFDSPVGYYPNFPDDTNNKNNDHDYNNNNYTQNNNSVDDDPFI